MIDFFLGIPLLVLLSLFKKLKLKGQPRSLPGNPRKILVILLGAVGDTLLLVPAMRLLKRKYPGARIYFFGTQVNRDLAGYVPGLDEVITFEFGQLLQGPRGLYNFWRLIVSLREQQFDLVLDFEKWVRASALVSHAAGSRYTAGFKTKKQYRHFCYDLRVEKANKHVMEVFLDLVKALPGTDAGETPKQVLDRHLIHRIKRYNPGLENYIVIHPGAGGNVRHGGRRIWPPARYARLIADVAAGHPELYFVLTGTAGEAALVHDILRRVPGRAGRVVVLAGQTNIHQMLGLIARASLVVCGNTGVMHMAVALDVPVVALHGPTDPHKWGPRGTKHIVVQSTAACAPCLDLGFEYRCRTARCMEMINYGDVLQAVNQVLAETGRRSGNGGLP